MEIPSNPILNLAATAKTNFAINKLQPGQQIIVEVVEQLPNKATTILLIGKQLVQAKTDIPLTPGQVLKVTVEKSASEIILKLPAKLQPDNTTNAALRQLMPKQAPISEFQAPLVKILNNIQQHSSTQPSQTTPLTTSLAQLKRISSDIVQSLSINKQITSANGLKVAVQNSGILLEAKLLQALSEQKTLLNAKQNLSPNSLPASLTSQQQTVIRTDLKANLSKLIQLLKSWPKPSTPSLQQTTQNPTAQQRQQLTQNSSSKQFQQHAPNPQNIESQIKELLSKTEGTLAKITLNQLASTNTETSSARQTWQLEIPLFNTQQAESIFLKIEKDQQASKSTNKGEQRWAISIEMTPPKLGIIRSKLSLVNDTVSSNFWAENENTRLLIQQHINLLRKQFKHVNLQADSIQVQQGTGPIVQDIKPSSNILSEKA